MTQFLDAAGIERLQSYFDEIGLVLDDDRRRASFAMYAMGLFGDGERKSVEPMAARACGDPTDTERAHDRLLHFMTDSRWSDREVRRTATRHAVSAMTARDPIRSWIVDDTGMLKQGTHSVGVQRQYTGSAGKVTNCQIAVSLSIATKTEHVPIDFELYLPKLWTDDPDRRQEARIPDEIEFRTKHELALEMIHRAVKDELPRGVGPGRLGLWRFVRVPRAAPLARSSLCRRSSRDDQSLARRWARPSSRRSPERQEARAEAGTPEVSQRPLA